MRYLAYNLLIDSELAIPGFPTCDREGEADVRVHLGPDPVPPHPTPAGEIGTAFVNIAELARFTVRAGQEIFVELCPDVPLEEAGYCLRGTIFGALLAQRGYVPIHASAVDSPQGAILLVGPPGNGKSTLAAALMQLGFPLLSDDFTAVSSRDGEIWIEPSIPELRLWQDALIPLGLKAAPGLTPIRPSIKKYGLVPPLWNNVARPARALLLLSEPIGSEVTLEQLTQEEALERLASCLYRWRLLHVMGVPRERIQDTFTSLVRNCQSFGPMTPRDFARLPELCEKIKAEIAQLRSRKAVHWSLQRPLPRIEFGEAIPPYLEDGPPGYALLTSYPKSGNTWVRAMLTSWRIGGQLLLSSMDGLANYRRRLDFEEVLGVDSELFDGDEQIHWRAVLFKDRAKLIPGCSPTKVHDQCVRNCHDELLYPPEVVVGVVYVVRNPLDVAVSLANHLRVSVTDAVAVMNDRDAKFCSDPREKNFTTIAPNFWQVTGSWSEHVLSWLDEPRHRVLLVRYEDLLADGVGQLQRIIEFLGVPWVPEKGRQVVRDCAFKTLQKEEKRQGFKERPDGCPAFFRKGSAGDWRSSLPPDLARKICQTHQDVMRRLGYEQELEEVLAAETKRR